MQFNFPRAKFVDENDITDQAIHVCSEAIETLAPGRIRDFEHMAEEMMDCLHSCETGLRILQEDHGINLNEVRRAVERKNREREYYEC